MERKGKKIWAWVLGSVAVLGILGYIGWQFFKKDLAKPNSKIAKPLLTDKVKDMIVKASDSLYRLEFKHFDLNIDSGRGVLRGVKLIPDTAIHKRLLLSRRLPNTVMHIRIDSIRIEDLGFKNTKAGKRFSISSITIYHPVARIVNKRQSWNDDKKDEEPSTLIKLSKKLLQISSVSTMRVQNLLFTWVDQNGNNEKETTFEHWNVKAEGFYASDAASKKEQRTERSVNYHVNSIRIATPDSLYHITFKGSDLSPEARSLTADVLEVEPRLGRTAFYKAVKYDKDRIHLIYKKLAFKNIDIDRIWQRQQFHIGKATVGSFWGEVLNDYHWPKRQPPIRPDPYPHQKLQNIAFDITIDTMLMRNGYFQYMIAARRSEENSKLFMTQIQNQVYNITNNRSAIQRHPYLTSYTQAKMMGAGVTTTTFKFHLADRKGSFNMLTKTGQMQASALDPLSKPLAQMSVREGTLNKMLMELNANTDRAKGHLDLYYKGMKLDLLKRDEKADTLKKRGFLSFLTNTFTPNDNPKKNGKFREGPINVSRAPRESFFGLIWKSTLDGMTSAMTGLEQHKNSPDESIVTRALKGIIKPHEQEKKTNTN